MNGIKDFSCYFIFVFCVTLLQEGGCQIVEVVIYSPSQGSRERLMKQRKVKE